MVSSSGWATTIRMSALKRSSGLGAGGAFGSSAAASANPNQKASAVVMNGILMPLQKRKCNASCICRMALAVEVICPAPPTSTMLPGRPRFTWLNALKFSQRNSIVLFSTITNSFESERLKTNRAGPRGEPLDASPSRYGACGAVYAAGLNHKFALGFDTPGLPMMSGRTELKSAFSRGALETPGENATPEYIVVMPLKRQPPATASAALLAFAI